MLLAYPMIRSQDLAGVDDAEKLRKRKEGEVDESYFGFTSMARAQALDLLCACALRA